MLGSRQRTAVGVQRGLDKRPGRLRAVPAQQKVDPFQLRARLHLSVLRRCRRGTGAAGLAPVSRAGRVRLRVYKDPTENASPSAWELRKVRMCRDAGLRRLIRSPAAFGAHPGGVTSRA